MATAKPKTVAANDGQRIDSDEQFASYKVEERDSHELIIGLTGPVGSGCTSISDLLGRLLSNDFGYDIRYIKVSDLISENEQDSGLKLMPNCSREERFEQFQSAGNALRNIIPTYLADRVIERINFLRRGAGGVELREELPDLPVQKKIAYVVDSLKNTAEVRRFRQVYGDLFWHITVFAPEYVREKRLIDDGVSEVSVKKIMKRDEDEGEKTGQQVSKTAHLADYFIRNHSNNIDSNMPAVSRFLDCIFGTKLYTPSAQEAGMMKASSAAVGSACLSRQVGAAIYSSDGELLGVGCNDVPKYGGGLYSSDLPDESDHRCFKWGGQKCHNDDQKAKLASAISRDIHPDNDGERNAVFRTVSQSNSKNLIEFSRSVHAEMEAIVSVARSGKGSTVKGVLYTTTFPCHNCARHIVAAGIVKVVYIEPYAKSLALKLHYDAITLTDEQDKVHFVQYEGFAPRSSLRIFSSVGRERKDKSGKFDLAGRRGASPLFPNRLDSYTATEELVIDELNALRGNNDGETQPGASTS